MINLMAYDDASNKIDRNKTWVLIKSKCLYSREINPRKYTSIIKRFDPKTKDTKYYIVTVDEIPDDKNFKSSKVDNFGRFKLNLSVIWKNTILNRIVKDTNINIVHTTHTDDGDIYYLDI